MKLFWKPLRAVAIGGAVLAAAFTSFGPGSVMAATHVARHSQGLLPKSGNTGNGDTHVLPPLGDPNLPKATFMGEIISVDGPDTADPSGFTLQFGMQTEDIKLAQKTMITGKTAEAVVEGLAPQDYAIVRAKRYKGTWYATRVVFDVQPLAPMRLISGTITRISQDLKHFVVKADSGKGAYFVRILRQTRFHLDGRPVDGVPLQWTFGVTSLAAQTLIRRDNGIWTAYDIYLSSARFERR